MPGNIKPNTAMPCVVHVSELPARRRWKLLLTAICVALLVGVPAAAGHAQTPVADEAGAEIRVRRLLVPEDELDELLKDRAGYLAYDRDEFEEKLSELKANTERVQPGVISSLALFGRVTRDGDFNGELFLNVAREPASGSLVEIAPLNLAISDPTWMQSAGSADENPGNDEKNRSEDVDDGESDGDAKKDRRDPEFRWPTYGEFASLKDDRRAIVGNSRNGKLQLQTDRTGILKLNCELPRSNALASSIAEDDRLVTTALSLPAAAVMELYITAPHDLVPAMSNSRVELMSTEDQSHSDTGAKPDSTDQTERTWRIRASGRSNMLLQFRRSSTPDSRENRPGYSEASTYRISSSGIQFTTTIRLAASINDSTLADFSLPASATCQSIRIDGDSVPFGITSGEGSRLPDNDSVKNRGSSDERIQIGIDSDVATSESFDSFTVSGFVPVRLNARNELPRVTCSRIRWQQGSSTVTVSDNLQISGVHTDGAQVTDFESELESANDLTFTGFDSDYSVSVSLAPILPQLSIDSLCRTDLGIDSISADQFSILRSKRGDIFSVSAILPADWILDSVSAEQPGSEPASGKVVEYWKLIDVDDLRKRLHVQFARPVSPRQPVSLRVKGHRTNGNANDLKWTDLRMLEFEHGTPGANVSRTGEKRLSNHGAQIELRAYVAVRTRRNTVVDALRGPSRNIPARLNVSELLPLLVNQSGVDESDDIFEIPSPGRFNNSRMLLARAEKERLTASIDSTLRFSDQRVTEQIVVKCESTFDRIERLRVVVRGGTEPIQWSVRDFAEEPGSNFAPADDSPMEPRLVVRRIELENAAGSSESNGNAAAGNAAAAEEPSAASNEVSPNEVSADEDDETKTHTWEIVFRPPLKRGYALVADHATKLREVYRPVHIELPDVAEVRSTMTVLSSRKQDVKVTGDGLKAIPIPTDSYDKNLNVIGRYRMHADSANSLVLRTFKQEDREQAFVEQLLLDYRYNDRASETLATFRVRNGAGISFRFRLPENSELLGIRVNKINVSAVVHDDAHNGEQPPSESAHQKTKSWHVVLPASQADHSVSVIYSGDAPASAIVNTLPIPVPEVDLPVIHSQQSIYIPDGWEVAEDLRPLNYRPTLVEEIRDRMLGGLTDFLFRRSRQRVSHVGFTFAPTANEKLLRFGETDLRWEGSGKIAPTEIADRDARWFSGRERVVQIPTTHARHLLINVRSIEILRWMLIIGSFCIAFGLPARWRRGLVPVAGIALAVCLLSPPLFSPLGAAVFWGICGSLLLHALRIAASVSDNPSVPNRKRTRISREAATTGAVILIPVLLFLATRCEAQEKDQRSEARIYYDVIQPIDDRGKVSGELVHVPRKLYSLLLSGQAQVGDRQTEAIMLSADYECVLKTDEMKDRPQIDRMIAEIRFRTLADDVAVNLPLNARLLLVDRETIRLDSISTSMRPNRDGEGLSLQVERAGEHRLAFEFLPRVRNADTWSEVSFSVPPIHASALVVVAPRSLDRIVVESDRFAVAADRFGRRFRSSPGATNRISFRWTNKPVESVVKSFRVEQLVRVDVDKNQIEHDYFWNLDTDEIDLPETIVVEIDDAVSLVADRSSELAEQRAPRRDVTDGRRRYVFEVDRAGRTAFVKAVFRDRGNPVGVFSSPSCTIQGARLSSSLLALVTREGLQVQPLNGEVDLQSDSPNTFVQLWNRAGEIDDSQISQVYRTEQPDSRLHWNVRPDSPDLLAVTTMDLLVGLERSELNGTINIESGNPQVQRLKLSLPPMFRFESVTSGSVRSSTAAILNDNQCELLLPENRGPTRISFSAIAVNRTQFPVPELRIEGVDRRSQTLSIRRPIGCRTSIEPGKWQSLSNPLSSDGSSTVSKQVAVLTLSNDAIAGTDNQKRKSSTGKIVVQRLPTQRDGTLITRVRRVDDDLLLEFDCNVKQTNTNSGSADSSDVESIEIRIAGDLPSDLTSDIPGRLNIVELPMSGERAIRFIPDQPFRDGARVVLQSGRIKSNFQLPTVRSTDFSRPGNHLVSLQPLTADPVLRWRLAGVRRLPKQNLPEFFRDTVSAEMASAESVVLAPAVRDYEIKLEASETRQLALRIPMQLTAIQWSGSDRFIGSSQFFLSACEATEIRFQHGQHVRIVDATVDSGGAQLECDKAECRITIPASDLPRILTLLLQGSVSKVSPANEFVFDLVTSGSHKVQNSQVDIEIDGDVLQRSVVSVSNPTSAQTSALSAIEMFFDFVVDVTQDSTIDTNDRSAWLEMARTKISQLLDKCPSSGLSDFERGRLSELQSRIQTVFRDGETEDPQSATLIDLQTEQPDPTSDQRNESGTGRRSLQVSCDVSSGSEKLTLTVANRDTYQQSATGRVWIAISLLGIAFVLSRPNAWKILRGVSPQFSLVIFALLGFAWSVYCIPAFVGWIMGLAALFLGIRGMIIKRRIYKRKSARSKARTSAN